MKKVAGFHSFGLELLAEDINFCGCRKNLGMIDCHTDGRVTRGKGSIEVV